MSLVLEIEFLTGTCRAARGLGIDAPDWPPQPDRVFSALVSAWGIRGELPVERAALEWLEQQDPPVIRSSDCTARSAPDVFVPPNDPKASKTPETYLKVLPDRRRRRPRRFPVARPDDPRMEFVWPEVPTADVLDALNALAHCVGYIGHSASLARCRFLAEDRPMESDRPSRETRRRVYPGRLRELESAHHARPERPLIRPGAPVHPQGAERTESHTEWLVLEVVEGEAPDIRTSALVARMLRQALMAGYHKAGWTDTVPELVSGLTPDGTPSRNPHVAIVPMAFVGFPHADSRVLGFALIPPRGESLLQMDGLRRAFEAVAPYHPDYQRRRLVLDGPPLNGPLTLAPAPSLPEAKQSLSPNRYLMEARRWASVTPIVLDRHLKRNDEAEVRELVAQSCRYSGLPRPDPDRIRIGKHSAIEGAPSARPLTGQPPWIRWKMPPSLESRQLVHAVIDFEQPICGPVLLGAGRYTGLGLCLGH